MSVLSIWIMVLGITLFYGTISCFVYRGAYRRGMIRYRRWQNEAPDAEAKWSYEYYRSAGPRKDVSWYNYSRSIASEPSPVVEGLAWPILLWGRPFNKWLHPEVAVPTVGKVADIEAELKQLDDEEKDDNLMDVPDNAYPTREQDVRFYSNYAGTAGEPKGSWDDYIF